MNEFFPSFLGDVDDEDNRCIFYLTSNSKISQISIPSHMPILLLMCIVGPFLNVPNAEGGEREATCIR